MTGVTPIAHNYIAEIKPPLIYRLLYINLRSSFFDVFLGKKGYITLFHGMDDIYLSDSYKATRNSSGSNKALLEHFKDNMREIANKLEDNCLNAVIKHRSESLIVHFDSTDPESPDATGLTYNWSFGDGHELETNEKVFSHTYLTSGTYDVSLTVTNEYGESDITQASVIVSDGKVNLTICSAGRPQYTMNFSLSTGDSFSLTNPNGYINIIFPCKELIVEENTRINISVTLSGTQEGIPLLPYSGSFNSGVGIKVWQIGLGNLPDGTQAWIPITNEDNLLD
jgi:PKD repeat protein